MDFSSIQSLDKSLIDEYLKSKSYNEEFETSMITTLFSHHNYELIIYSLKSGFVLTETIVHAMEKSGNLQLYQYMDELRLLLSIDKLVHFAVHSGNLDTVQWLRSEFRMNLDSLILDRSIAAGNVEIYKWIIQFLSEPQDPTSTAAY